MGRGRPPELDGVFGGHGAGRSVEPLLVHEVVCGSPITVAVEERANDAAVQDAWESLVHGLRLPRADDLVAFYIAFDFEPILVGWAAAKALVLKCVAILQTLRHVR